MSFPKKLYPAVAKKPTLPSPNLYQALYDFEGSDGSLAFAQDDLFELLEMYNDEWFLVKAVKTKEQGFVPSNFVQKCEMSPRSNSVPVGEAPTDCNLGDLKRDEAEKMLTSCKDGTFLVRTSEHRPTDYTLSVKDGPAVAHYPVVKAKNGSYYITRKTPFNTINELVDYYSADNSDGLCVRLGEFVNGAQKAHGVVEASKWQTPSKKLNEACATNFGRGVEVASNPHMPSKKLNEAGDTNFGRGVDKAYKRLTPTKNLIEPVDTNFGRGVECASNQHTPSKKLNEAGDRNFGRGVDMAYKRLTPTKKQFEPVDTSSGRGVEVANQHTPSKKLNETVDTNFGRSVEQPNRLLPSNQMYETIDPSLSLEVDFGQLTCQNLLGSGKSCQVFKGMWFKQPVAIKKLNGVLMGKDVFLAEANVMKRLKHPNILQLLAICSQPDSVCLVLELCTIGCLQEYLKKDLDEKDLIYMAQQVADGMAYMQMECCIHRNLAARNILVAGNKMVKIADFGLAKYLGTVNQYMATPGERYPVKWTAPEAVEDSIFSIKSDVWSFGIVLVELWTNGDMPYKGIRNADIMSQIKSGYRIPKPDTCPQKIYEVMVDCWNINPVQRPDFMLIKRGFESIVDDCFYENI